VDPSRNSRFIALVGAAVLSAAAAAFIACLLPLGLDRDDIAVMNFTSHTSYSEIWSTPFRDLYYRPIVVTITKLSTDLFGASAVPLRVLQGILIATSLGIATTMFRKDTSSTIRTILGLCLLASPMTFISVAQFGVGIADGIVLVAFLAAAKWSFGTTDSDASTGIYFVFLSLIAILAKESGLLVVAFCLLEQLRRRQWRTALVLLGLAGGYLVLRMALVETEPYPLSSGFMLDMHSRTALQMRFGDSPILFYLYNVLANLCTVFVYVPERGQFHLTVLIAFFSVAFVYTSIITTTYVVRTRAWRRHAPLIAIILLNAVIGYSYVRSRVMFVGYAALTLLFVMAVDDIRKRQQPVLGIPARHVPTIALVLWLAMWITTMCRLWRMDANGTL